DPVTGLLKITATPLQTEFTPVGPVRNVTVPKSLTLQILVNNAGTLIGGVPGPDFQVTGNISNPPNSYNGVLLEGEILGFGYDGSGATTDALDFRFHLTGGALAPLYGSNDIAVVTTVEHSNFTGSFLSAWTGGAKGNIGPIPAIACTGKIGDYVW